jgi:tetratricopeptide (TPR) repeat protein
MVAARWQSRGPGSFGAALGHDRLDVATTHNDMGVVYELQGKYAEALEVYSNALDIRASALGRDHPSVADTECNTALARSPRRS